MVEEQINKEDINTNSINENVFTDLKTEEFLILENGSVLNDKDAYDEIKKLIENKLVKNYNDKNMVLTGTYFSENNRQVDIKKYLNEDEIEKLTKFLRQPSDELDDIKTNMEPLLPIELRSCMNTLLNVQSRISNNGAKAMHAREVVLEMLEKLDKEILDLRTIYIFIREKLKVDSGEFYKEDCNYDCERNASMDDYPEGEILEDEIN